VFSNKYLENMTSFLDVNNLFLLKLQGSKDIGTFVNRYYVNYYAFQNRRDGQCEWNNSGTRVARGLQFFCIRETNMGGASKSCAAHKSFWTNLHEILAGFLENFENWRFQKSNFDFFLSAMIDMTYVYTRGGTLH